MTLDQARDLRDELQTAHIRHIGAMAALDAMIAELEEVE